MKKVILSLSLALCCMFAASAKGNDPVLMTVNNKPVKVSEFEYLYQKNNAQQMSEQPIDEYIDLFVIYKLKVAAAEAAGLDNTDEFKKEYAGYSRDLSEPYLTDRGARDSLVRLIYDRLKEEVDVSHVMVSLGKGAKENATQHALLDSLRTEILAGRADFAETADRYSIDPAAKRNHGHMGWISASVYPYTFEDAAYETAVGEISPVIETPFGYHIVKVNGRRNNPGMVKVQHILKLTRDLSEEDQAIKKAQIDSIYNLLAAGADFNELAQNESEDRGSAANGGVINYFGSGRMVPEFEEVSFSLANGETSKPFKTDYGYHIVRRLDWKGLDPFEDLEPRISDFIARDERQTIPMRHKVMLLNGKYGTKTNTALVESIQNEIEKNGALSTDMADRLKTDRRKVVTFKKADDAITVADLFETLPAGYDQFSVDIVNDIISKRLKELTDNKVVEIERANLAIENPEYRNLLNEYRDGMLLFEISDRNVWSKSKSDVEGLNKFFNDNRSKYSNWTAPKFKGYVVFATNDSIMNLAQDFLANNKIDNADLVDTMRKKFGKEIRVERVLAAKGDNAIIDGLAFGAAKPEPTGKWVSYFSYDGKIIDQPEEPADERGAVTTDYQNLLEKEWVEQLRKQYPVNINQKVLKNVKAKFEKK